jgi:hypothetical protein
MNKSKTLKIAMACVLCFTLITIMVLTIEYLVS